MGMAPSIRIVLYYMHSGKEYLPDPLFKGDGYFIYFENEEIVVNDEEDWGERSEDTLRISLGYGWGKRVKIEDIQQKHGIMERLGKYLTDKYGGSYTINLTAAFN